MHVPSSRLARTLRNIGGRTAFADLMRRFERDERGITAILFGIMFTGILMAAAMAVDYTRAVTEQTRQQAALDAAVLAASSRLGKPDQDTSGPALARLFFAENLRRGSDAAITNINFNSVNGEISATSSSALSTTLMKAFGHDHMDVGAASSVVRGDSKLEIAMVLDNSGSMAGTYIADLKTAAKNLTAAVFAGVEGTDKVKVGVVPFAASVNVGNVYRNASWMDGGAVSSIHSENFDMTKSRFDLFDQLNVSWGGCVEQRPGALDTDDTPPTSGNPDSLFVPMFAPDEPDDSNASAAGYSNYGNDYISDFGGTCPAPNQVCVSYNKKTGACKQWAPEPIPVATAQARTCKYSGATVSGSGPNYMCTTKSLLPLTQTKATVDAKIDSIAAGGNTNIGEGTMWGWRVLSPDLPFTEGRPYSETDNRKIMIVMTDGQNTYSATNNPNKSYYGAAGYAAKGRLGTTYTSSAYTTKMDDKFIAACTHAKAAGITIYTIAFRLESDPDTQQLLTSCANSPDNFYAASDGSTLIQAFQNIGKELSQLRVSN